MVAVYQGQIEYKHHAARMPPFSRGIGRARGNIWKSSVLCLHACCTLAAAGATLRHHTFDLLCLSRSNDHALCMVKGVLDLISCESV